MSTILTTPSAPTCMIPMSTILTTPSAPTCMLPMLVIHSNCSCCEGSELQVHSFLKHTE